MFWLPNQILDRSGRRVDTASEVWQPHVDASKIRMMHFDDILNRHLKYAFKKFSMHSLQKHSSTSTVARHDAIKWLLNKTDSYRRILESDDVEIVKSKLILTINELINILRKAKKFDRFYVVKMWYLWCVDHIPEHGFCPEFALEVSRIRVPGGPKGEAVKGRDEELGPLHFEVEEPLLLKFLRLDASTDREHLQQRAAVSLCFAYGRNSLNFCRLRESDLVNVLAECPEKNPVWILRIPRIKKGGDSREFFREETCSDSLAETLLALIESNKNILQGADVPGDRPLFMRSTPLEALLNGDSTDWAYHMDTGEFRFLLKDWVSRHNIISPLTGGLLLLTPRRLRYTFACGMVRQGVTRLVLAELLDHSDTQNVGVYYTLFEDMLPMLDKALAKKFGDMIGLFSGTIVSDDAEAVNGGDPAKHMGFSDLASEDGSVDIGVCGQSDICHLDPPYSCYLCPKFQAYQHANHERVLEILLEDRHERIRKYENNRLGIQLDDVIWAIGEVVKKCDSLNNGGAEAP